MRPPWSNTGRRWLQDPTNIEYKLKYEQTRFTAAFEHFQQGRRALALQ